jgi:hypothetical protein
MIEMSLIILMHKTGIKNVLLLLPREILLIDVQVNTNIFLIVEF